MKFVGIDLAWGEQKPSGVAVIDAEGTLQNAAADLRKNGEICQFAALDSPEGAVVAIDAPLVVKNADRCRPVEELVTKIFWPYDAAPFPANLSNPAFQENGRIRQLMKYLEGHGFIQRPVVSRRQEQRIFLEVFPIPTLVMLFPGENRLGHVHCRALRYKNKGHRQWVEIHSEWEIYRARLRSLECREPALKFSPSIKRLLAVDISDYRGARYKYFDDLLDGILCAYLAYYYWYWGHERSWIIGDIETGYIVLPKCPLKGCPIPVGE